MHAVSHANTAAGIVRALRPAETNAIMDAAVARIEARARRSTRWAIRDGARQFIATPWRLRSTVGMWHDDPAVMVVEAQRRRDASIKLGRNGHWAFDQNRLMGLRQACLALRYMRRFGADALVREREFA